jgi:hypothetical protein
MGKKIERFIRLLAPGLALKRAKARRELQQALKPPVFQEKRKPVDSWLFDDRRERTLGRPELF